MSVVLLGWAHNVTEGWRSVLALLLQIAQKKQMGEYQQPKIDTSIKLGSFAFYLAIPCAIGFTTAAVMTITELLSSTSPSQERLTLAAYGFIASIIVFSSKRLATFRTFLHEFKHAVVVLLSGNRVKDFKVHHRQGHVSYLMYSDRVRFAPFIMLAPYFFPLLSLPIFAFALFANHDPQHLIAIALSAALAGDLTCAYKDYHPDQSDLQRISGGWLPVVVFILGLNTMWSSFCLLWLLDGRNGFVEYGSVLMTHGQEFVRYLQSL